MPVQLGDKVKDIITGFSGIAVARTQWLHGCDRITIEPDKTEKGVPVDSFVFDEQRVEIVKAMGGPPIAKAAKPVVKTGGPQNDRVATRRL